MQTLQGTVVGNKNAKTLLVEVNNVVKHPKYKKLMTRTKRFQVHTDAESVAVGSSVIIVSCRPMSKTKSFRLEKVTQSPSNSVTKGTNPKTEVKKEVKEKKW
jgi:small subunit ribosomal protein S17